MFSLSESSNDSFSESVALVPCGSGGFHFSLSCEYNGCLTNVPYGSSSENEEESSDSCGSRDSGRADIMVLSARLSIGLTGGD
jgi:hypothetical protein